MESLSPVDKRMSAGLALLSVGLGVAQLLAPNALSRAIGIRAQPGTLRALGLREIANGIAMLRRPRSPAGPTARVAGDVMDLALLGSARRRRFRSRKGLTIAILAVAVVAAIDLLAAQRFATRGR